MARLLLLSTTTGYQLRSFNDAAERAGVEILFATDRCHTLDDPWQDRAVAVRFYDEDASLDAILDAVSARPIDAILAVGDRPTVLAARAAEALQLPGNPPDAARASAHKLLARERFASAGLPVPWFHSIPLDQPAVLAADQPFLRFPCVVKPVALSGSRGVIRADSREEFARVLDRVQRLMQRRDVREIVRGGDAGIMVEGFIDGDEYAIEGVLTDGRFTPFAVFDKPDPLDGPLFEETIYVTPSRAPAERQRAMIDAVARAAHALGLRHGPIHAECRATDHRVAVLEVAARPIGGLCSRVLRFESVKGERLSLEEVLLRHALGSSLESVGRERPAAAVMMIPIPGRGVLKRVEGVPAALAVTGVDEVRITAKPDQVLEPLPEAGSYLGFIFARAGTPYDAEAAVREAHQQIAFAIDPLIEVRSV
jgi:biotin carboxylase